MQHLSRLDNYDSPDTLKVKGEEILELSKLKKVNRFILGDFNTLGNLNLNTAIVRTMLLKERLIVEDILIEAVRLYIPEVNRFKLSTLYTEGEIGVSFEKVDVNRTTSIYFSLKIGTSGCGRNTFTVLFATCISQGLEKVNADDLEFIKANKLFVDGIMGITNLRKELAKVKLRINKFKNYCLVKYAFNPLG